MKTYAEIAREKYLGDKAKKNIQKDYEPCPICNGTGMVRDKHSGNHRKCVSGCDHGVVWHKRSEASVMALKREQWLQYVIGGGTFSFDEWLRIPS